MSKKLLIALVIVVILVALGVLCRQIEVKHEGDWTNSSEKLLEIKKYPKKTINKKNLFD